MQYFCWQFQLQLKWKIKVLVSGFILTKLPNKSIRVVSGYGHWTLDVCLMEMHYLVLLTLGGHLCCDKFYYITALVQYLGINFQQILENFDFDFGVQVYSKGLEYFVLSTISSKKFKSHDIR